MPRFFIIAILLCAFTFTSMAQEKGIYIIKESHALLRAHSKNSLSYVWFLNGQPVNGEHNEKLLTTQAGIYTVIGLNTCCESELSDPAEIIFSKEADETVDMAIS